MTKEEWIKQAQKTIENNDKYIAEIDDMVGYDYTRHSSQKSAMIWENKFLNNGIRLMESE